MGRYVASPIRIGVKSTFDSSMRQDRSNVDLTPYLKTFQSHLKITLYTKIQNIVNIEKAVIS